MSQPSDRSVREVVAQADRRRRARAADRLLSTAAPVVAAVVLALSLVTRLAGWPRLLPVFALVIAALGLLAFALIQRRARASTDAMAAAVDRDAALRGELRSAHWFETTPVERDPWVDFHVARAEQAATGVDWAGLYPAVKATRQWAVTGLLGVAVIALAVRVPVRASPAQVLAESLGDAALAEALPKELQEKLAALLAQLEAGQMEEGAEKVSLEELKDLMAKLDPALQKKLAELLEKKALGDMAKAEKNPNQDQRPERAENATAGLPEDVKWALEDMANRMAQANQDRQTNENNPSASSETGEKGMGSAQAEQKAASMSEAASPMVRESASDPGGKMMMGGGGPMGGDSRPGAGGNQGAQQGAAEALLVAQALRKEMVEASADALGENIEKEDRRKKTEQGTSTLGYTRVAPPSAFEPSRAAAPPPVPEARRQLLLTYFLRKR